MPSKKAAAQIWPKIDDFKKKCSNKNTTPGAARRETVRHPETQNLESGTQNHPREQFYPENQTEIRFT